MAALLAMAFALQAQEELKPGLIGAYYDMGEALEEMPAVPKDKKPDLRRIDPQVNFEPTGEKFEGTELADHFYVRWTGILRVPKDGRYTFFTESDDGSTLRIDAKVVVDNDGLHPMQEESGDIELKAGDHAITIQLFENEGAVGCKVSWKVPGAADREIIPASALFHKTDKDLDK
jgi:hypothetical protein